MPRVVYTDPQAAAVGAAEGAFSATAALSAVAKTATYTRAYAESNGFLTLLSDGERLTGAYALGPEAGEWLQQATLAIRARVPLDDAARHDPAVPDVLGDLRRGAQGAAGASQSLIPHFLLESALFRRTSGGLARVPCLRLILYYVAREC